MTPSKVRFLNCLLEKRLRFVNQYQLALNDAEALTSERDLANFYEEAAKKSSNSKQTANWILNNLLQKLNETGKNINASPVSPEHIADLVNVIQKGTISTNQGKEIFEKMWTTGKKPSIIVDESGMTQISGEEEVGRFVDEVIRSNPEVVERLRKGEVKLQGVLVGLVMKTTKGKANPELVNRLSAKKSVNFLPQRHKDMIKMFHATKRYDHQYVALNDVTLNIPKGQFAFLTGASGAGKSTLLRLLIREEIATSGQIIVNGRNIAIIPDHQIPILRRNIGFVFQDFKLLKRKTVYENVTFVLHVIGASPRIQKKRAFEILKTVGLQHKMHSFPQQLSGGEQQRVAIARALIKNQFCSCR